MAGSAERAGLLLAGLLLLVSCTAAPTRGFHHVVARGENLFRIGKAYGVDYRELARRNGIRDPARIEVGQRVFVPGATRRVPVDLVTPSTVVSARPAPHEVPVGEARFRWPIGEGRLA